MAPGFALGFGFGRAHRTAGGVALLGGGESSPIVLPTAPTVRYHPGFSMITVGGDGRVLSASDLMALAGATATAGNGPLQLTDALGRKYWRFSSAQWMTVANTLASQSSQSIAIFAVGRFFGLSPGGIYSLGVNGVNAGNTGGAMARIFGDGQGTAAVPYAATRTAGVSARAPLLVGCQMQVIGCVGRSTGNGNARVYVNKNGVSSGGAPTSAGLIDGGEIGRYSSTPANSYLSADIYEIVIYKGTLTDGQADAIAASLSDGYGIPALTHSVAIGGDSIGQGQGTAAVANIYGMLTEPGGTAALPMTTRVLCEAIPGSGFTKAAHLNPTTRRDTAGSVFDAALQLSGDVPELLIQIGRNDWSNTPGSEAASADSTYASLVAYLNTASTGVLQRGWRVVYGVNIVAQGLQVGNDAYRTRIRAAQFLTDCLAGSGDAYDGRLVRADLAAITVGGATLFNNGLDWQSATYFQDGTHPTTLGNQMMLTGGDTPANGYRSKML